MKICAYCLAENQENANNCIFCGHNLGITELNMSSQAFVSALQQLRELVKNLIISQQYRLSQEKSSRYWKYTKNFNIFNFFFWIILSIIFLVVFQTAIICSGFLAIFSIVMLIITNNKIHLAEQNLISINSQINIIRNNITLINFKISEIGHS